MFVESISFYKYELNPLKKANRFNKKIRSGLLLRYEINNKIGYSDYFPWEELGDTSLDVVINDLLNSNKTKLLNLLIKQAKNFSEIDFYKLSNFKFKNHVLVNDNQNCENKFVKIKVGTSLCDEIANIKRLIKLKNTLRIDANGLFDYGQMVEFWANFSDEEKKQIEYVEDPTPFDQSTWNRLKNKNISLAIDRVPNWDQVDQNTIDFVVFKPNILDRDNLKLNCPIIYSSYMGHDVGRIFALFDLFKNGDPNLYHGIDTPNLYKEQLDLFEIKENLYSLNLDNTFFLLKSLEDLPWQTISLII